MDQDDLPPQLRIENVFHPSDFSTASVTAFIHALKIALMSRADLTIFHVAANPDVAWEDFPGVRETLERWGLLPPGSPRSAVVKLGIDVRKLVVDGADPVRCCVDYLDTHSTDLIALAVHRHEGRVRWLRSSIGEPIVRRSGQMALFIPHEVVGFVSPQDGSVRLQKILIPIAGRPRPQPSLEAAARLIRNLRLPSGEVRLLHVGTAGDAPAVKVPEQTGWTWTQAARAGDPVETILQQAAEFSADLVVMTTDGPDGFLDGLRGSTSERVLHQSRCPVAILPAGSLAV